MVLREVPLADSVDAIPEPLRVILLGPPEQDARAIPFNRRAIEPNDEASDHQPEPEAPSAPKAPAAPAAPQRAPLASLPSRSKRRARQAADREVRAAQRNALLQDSDDSDSSDPFAKLSA